MATVSVFARHSADCPKADDPHWKRCRCPKWHYSPEWTPTRRTAKTRSWEEAERRARVLEAPQAEAPDALGKSIADAVKFYREDKGQQALSGSWEYKIRRETLQFEAWCKQKPVLYLRELTLHHLEDYRKTWKGAAITRKKRQERLRSFFSYCQRHGWIERNAASFLSPIRTGTVPTDYFTQEEFAAILEAVKGYNPKHTDCEWRRERVRAMILLLRYSGLRISDAARLERSRIQGDKLFLYTQKTGTPVWVPLPPYVAKALRELPNPASKQHFFWSGAGDLRTPGKRWWETLKIIFKAAGITKRAHVHMLRDTFAIELLLAGVPIEQVSILLGHSSIRITEKSYSPWVKARQEQLERSVRSSW
jgi:integrase/recombinase XerD